MRPGLPFAGCQRPLDRPLIYLAVQLAVRSNQVHERRVVRLPLAQSLPTQGDVERSAGLQFGLA